MFVNRELLSIQTTIDSPLQPITPSVSIHKFSHEAFENHEEKQINEIREDLEELRNQIVEENKEIKIKDDEIKALNNRLQSRVRVIEKKNKTMKEAFHQLKFANESNKAMINTN